MKVTGIPFEKTGQFSDLIIDYLNDNNSLREFYSYIPNIGSFKNAIDAKKTNPVNRGVLCSVLNKQYAGFEIKPVVRENIDLLRKENTFCIVTAHQLNIFLGPLYIVYKTLTTIKLCEQLKSEYPQYDFVPVFWLGSEDHDFEEINHVDIFGKQFAWNDKQGGACGQYNPQTLKPVIDELKSALGENDRANEIISIFSTAYLDNQNLARSARYYLNEFFGDRGLVIVDGDDIELKKLCSSIAEDELMNHSTAKIVGETISKMDHPAQANPRDINLFYLKEGLRERLVKEGNEFSVTGTSIHVSLEELLTELDEHPERFSPNVLLRPLYQQKILPALAYVGGGGEIAYWLQLKSLFEHHQIPFPVLALRNSFTLLDEFASKKINKLGLDISGLFEDENKIINKIVEERTGGSLKLSGEKKKIEELFDAILHRSVSVDSSLDKTIMAERQSVLNSLDKLEAKILKSEKTKMENEVNLVHALKEKLFPGNELQERHENFIPWYLKYGREFFEIIYSNTFPLNKNLMVIEI